MTTGVFFHEAFVGRPWPIIGDRYRGFPELLHDLSHELPAVETRKPAPAPMDLLLAVHEKRYVEEVQKDWYYEAARLTVGGCVQAAEMVWNGTLSNAVAFLVAAGHHAHPDHGWGGTYLSCIGPMRDRLRQLGLKKLAYIDTDSHHGDGARNMLRSDQDALHICFCSQSRRDEGGTKLCVKVGWHTTDQGYLEQVAATAPILRQFAPELIVHFFGHDTHRDDYGSRGLSAEAFIQLAAAMKEQADQLCGGKYVVIDGGGANAAVGSYIWPRIIRILAGA
jgi:acetoin utilization protein AcuC